MNTNIINLLYGMLRIIKDVRLITLTELSRHMMMRGLNNYSTSVLYMHNKRRLTLCN